MDILSLFSPERIACETEVSSKKRAIERLATMLANAQSGISTKTVFDALINREKLGSTTLGNGVAIPHACLPISNPSAALLLLQEGIGMDAPDKKPVQLFVALLVPNNRESSHADLITELAGVLQHKSTMEQLEQLHSPSSLMDYLTVLFSPPEQRIAA